jgi:gamma-glutamylcyclotransferase (GGCT)/AIG2-like uncharacterized protein YtfP
MLLPPEGWREEYVLRQSDRRGVASTVNNKVFFYGTLMSGFDRRRRAGIDTRMTFVGRGWIEAALFDLGLFPAAVPAPGSQVWGEVHEVDDDPDVMARLDEIEGYRSSEPDTSLYTRLIVPVTFDDGRVERVWVYFYNAPLGQADRIASGDYLEHLRVR